MLKLNGVFAPLPTSFDQDENLSLDKMKINIEKLSQSGLAGFLALGSNGELVNLSDDEKQLVYETAREAIPSDKIMLAGTGGQSTRETIKLTKEAAKAGADAALVLNPFYFKGAMTREVLVNHYFAVAENSTIPVLIYNMPGNSGLDMDAETILAISAHPNIIGMKDSGGNMVKMGNIRHRVKPEFQILAGSAGFLLPALTIGAIGGILALANIAPEQCVKIYKSFSEGDLVQAREMQLKMISINFAVTGRWGVPALKAAMDYLGYYGGPPRKPMLPVKQGIKDELIKILNECSIRGVK
jgi:4-hydroxy-2-oxoglutarate aldolase